MAVLDAELRPPPVTALRVVPETQQNMNTRSAVEIYHLQYT